MKSIDVETVRPYVKGVIHSLELAQYRLKENDPRSVGIEIYNAMVELQALLAELDKLPEETQ